MKTYKLNHHEYTKLARRMAQHSNLFAHESTLDILMDLLYVKFDAANLYFEVPEKLMQRMAIANMCEMCLAQLRDSGGEIDYADLGDYSIDVINSILYNFI